MFWKESMGNFKRCFRTEAEEAFPNMLWIFSRYRPVKIQYSIPRPFCSSARVYHSAHSWNARCSTHYNWDISSMPLCYILSRSSQTDAVVFNLRPSSLRHSNCYSNVSLKLRDLLLLVTTLSDIHSLTTVAHYNNHSEHEIHFLLLLGCFHANHRKNWPRSAGQRSSWYNKSAHHQNFRFTSWSSTNIINSMCEQRYLAGGYCKWYGGRKWLDYESRVLLPRSGLATPWKQQPELYVRWLNVIFNVFIGVAKGCRKLSDGLQPGTSSHVAR